MNPEALIFDMDGVLIDNSPFYARAWDAFLQQHPEAALPDYPASKTFGRRNADLLHEVFAGQLSTVQVAAYSEHLERLYWQMYLPHLTPIAGLLELMGEAKRRSMPLALATSAPLASVDTVLQGLGLQQPPVFNSILTELDVRRGKPDPQVYQDSMLRLGVAPERCVIFEDALVGVAAGCAAGARCIGLATTYAPELLLEQGAEMVIADYTDPRLRPWLGWG